MSVLPCPVEQGQCWVWIVLDGDQVLCTRKFACDTLSSGCLLDLYIGFTPCQWQHAGQGMGCR